MKVSIIIPVKKINNYIRESLPYLLNLDYDDYEILILPDEEENEKVPKVKIIPTGKIGPSEKRDLGAKIAKGEILAFIDDDAYPREDWLRNSVDLLKDKEIAAVCGPGITPNNDSILQKASGAVFESFLGGGGLTYRYKKGKRRFVDNFPSCNFIIKKQIFNEIGGFNSEFWPGEDTKLCRDIIKHGYKILYDPEILVWHHRRKLFLPHIKQVWNYSLHRGYFVKKIPENSFKIGYFIPSIFVLGLILGLILSFFNSIILYLYGSVLIFYLFLALVSLISIKGIRVKFLALLGIFLTHIFYGVGFIRGLLTKKLIV